MAIFTRYRGLSFIYPLFYGVIYSMTVTKDMSFYFSHSQKELGASKVFFFIAEMLHTTNTEQAKKLSFLTRVCCL